MARAHGVLFLITLTLAGGLAACSESSDDSAGDASGGSGAVGAAGDGENGGGAEVGASGDAMTIGSGIGGSGFNQCGVSAPLPAETGQCTVVSAPTIANFDDYNGGDAASYGYSVSPEPPAANVLGGILHIDDGSDTDGSKITTEMVTGTGDSGYAIEIANTNATDWGGLLMFYFPGAAPAIPCLDARAYSGLRFSIKGSSPSGRFGVNLGMLDTTPTGDNGLCDNASVDDCKNANVELSLPKDADTWLDVELPWSAFTPGLGSGLSCVPVTGQNILHMVIQPFMSYPPPDYTFQAGPYSIVVDDVRFY